MSASNELPANKPLNIRRVTSADIEHVVSLDARITDQPKPEFWQDIYDRYGARRLDERFFLVADFEEGGTEEGIIGMIVGEVRGWEFGSEPCGWVFAVSVDPNQREKGIGEQLFKAICAEFKQVGISKVRTMVRRESTLHMSFFRGEGMMAGPYTQLEMTLDDV